MTRDDGVRLYLPACACGATDYRSLRRGVYNRSTAHGYTFEVVACQACGLARSLPVPDDAQYEHGFALTTESGSFVGSTTDAYSASVAAHVARNMRGQRLLDVGCHTGALVEAAAGLGLEADGIDVDPLAIEAGRALGRRIRIARVEELDGTYDALVLNHVLEHVAALEPFLGNVARLLAPTGQAFVFVPNRDGLMAKVMGQRWMGLAPHMHVWHFTPATLRRTVESLSPLRVVSCTTRGVIEPTSKGVKGIVKDGLRGTARLLRSGDQLEAILERAPTREAADGHA